MEPSDFDTVEFDEREWDMVDHFKFPKGSVYTFRHKKDPTIRCVRRRVGNLRTTRYYREDDGGVRDVVAELNW